jgi:hypothetical protein
MSKNERKKSLVPSGDPTFTQSVQNVNLDVLTANQVTTLKDYIEDCYIPIKKGTSIGNTKTLFLILLLLRAIRDTKRCCVVLYLKAIKTKGIVSKFAFHLKNHF